MVPSLPLMSCELPVSVKENPDRKKKQAKQKTWDISTARFQIFKIVRLFI